MHLLSSFSLVGIFPAVTNDRHITIHPSTPHTAPLTTRSYTEHLRHPVRIHPAANSNSCSTAPARRRCAQHPLLFLLPLTVCVSLRTHPRRLIFSENESLARTCLGSTWLRCGYGVFRPPCFELKVLFEVNLQCRCRVGSRR